MEFLRVFRDIVTNVVQRVQTFVMGPRPELEYIPATVVRRKRRKRKEKAVVFENAKPRQCESEETTECFEPALPCHETPTPESLIGVPDIIPDVDELMSMKLECLQVDIVENACDQIQYVQTGIPDDFRNRNIIPDVDESMSTKLECLQVDIVESACDQIQYVQTGTPDDFRNHNIIPDVVELSKNPVFLRANIVDDTFESAHHYLDIQFRLMKEDYMAGIRNTIGMFRSNILSHTEKYDYEGGRFFRGVRLVKMKKFRYRIGILVSIDMPLINRTPNPFLTGSLLFFSKDTFDSWFFGTVLDSNNFLIDKTIIVSFDNSLLTEELFGSKSTYMMFCSKAFYPFYQPILKYLQSTDKLPMENLIVKRCYQPKIPRYVPFTDWKIGSNSVNLRRDTGWPSHKSLKLDLFQFEAFKMALTNNFSIIHGPPGTGKTYIALKIIDTMLRNIKKSEKPIVVLSLTNHALDQFLRGILEITNNVVRIGSRSEEEDFNTICNLNKKRKKNRYTASIHFLAKLIEKVDKVIEDIDDRKRIDLGFLDFVYGQRIFSTETKMTFDVVRRSLETLDRHNDLALNEFKSLLFILMKNLSKDHTALLKEYKKREVKNDLSVLRDADVVAITTTRAAASKTLLTALAPKIVIVEESAIVPESHIVVNLDINCQHIILIGDHKQLRPSTASYKLARDYKLNISLFERLIYGCNYRQLVTQHRMRLEISNLITPLIYENLNDHHSVKQYPNVKGVSKNIFFIHHDYPETKMNFSFNNENEACFAIILAIYLLKQGYSQKEITILGAYKSQVEYLKWLRNVQSIDDVNVSSIDGYQGLENQIIILCLVRNNMENKIGFLNEPNRICVALSRAKQGLFIFGNANNLRAKSEFLASIIQNLEEKNCIGKEIPIKCPRNMAFTSNQSCNGDHMHKCRNDVVDSWRTCPEGHIYSTFCIEENYCEKVVSKIFKCSH
ncbi:NFX1-type zinc finger-containing protein 1-like [Arctopsyche grandis]|uniref:NFX1-type zinc finger-containing protein 1-like n=1 Tax=Arctopsyche grandis TaxID=121162 RepID=UPI00406D86FD